MLYKKNLAPSLDATLFQNPSSEYRGTPFWSWNSTMEEEQIDQIITDLKKMGMGGAHLHSRTGMAVPYLTPRFMNKITHAHEKLSELDMITWLYDEDRWPSGSAGGLVTRDHACRMRYLLFSPEELPEEEDVAPQQGGSSARPVSSGRRRFLGKYAVLLENGFLADYKLLTREATECQIGQDLLPQGYRIWYLYREISGNSGWYNDQAYVDTLNPKAIDKFIQLTHETYYKTLGQDFGVSVPAIFTDEPQFCHKQTLGYAQESRPIILPFTDDFDATYQEAYGCDFFSTFPECIWELPGSEVSVHRYHYHDHICERFSSAFADNIGGWCRQHGIALTGHMMEEPTLRSQTAALGEAMRSYRAFDLPGIDMLCDDRELTTAKQAQSAVHQFGYEGMLSELYGVTNWDFDFRGHKLGGDWQAALGVTIRVHHLTWTSMAGEAKRDYPASIGYQSPWYKEYPYIEDYFGRLNTALTRGVANVRVGVVHPIESYWLYWGPAEQTDGIRQEMDDNFQHLTRWLLYGLVDFDFISESLWKEQTPDTMLAGEGDFLVGKMKYDVILVPNCVTLRRSTLERLKAFQAKGGRVIFTGTIPTHVDAIRCQDVSDFADTCEKIGFAENTLLAALEPVRTVEVRLQDGRRSDNLLYQMRNDGENKWLFLAHCNKMPNPDLPKREELTIRVTGTFHPTLYDALTGEIQEVPCRHVNGCTVIEKAVYDHDSLLYLLTPQEADTDRIQAMANASHGQGISGQDAPEAPGSQEISLPCTMEVSLADPNVLVLDLAESKLDDGQWLPEEEILRLDNHFRKLTGYPLRTESFPQPWVYPEKEEVKHHIALRFHIQSEVAVAAPSLALENADQTRLFLNDREVPSTVTGYFTDRSIQTVTLPDLVPGENILVAEMPYYNKFNVEAMYLLGDFGVRVAGRSTVVTAPVRTLTFGNICTQGLPFYGGNLTYRIPATLEKKGSLRVEATRFRCPLVKVILDGTDCGRIALSPYSITIPDVEAGTHMLELTAFGNRINTFGTLHNCNDTYTWAGPDSWRSTGPAWAYEYQLRPCGILVSPVVTLEKAAE